MCRWAPDGFGDQYSDIDLIFSTFSADQLASLRTRVERMFADAVYIRPKPLPAGVFLYVFLKNGLEFDIVLLPTQALQVRSSHWKILTDKTGQVLQRMHSSQLEEMDQQTFRGTLVEWEFEIIYALRGILFEIQRENFLYVLSRMEFVRDKLVRLQCYYEKKETHQFKDYRTLDEDFQLRLRGTYPLELARQPMLSCTQRLLQLFLKQHSDNQVWEIDSRMLDILKV